MSSFDREAEQEVDFGRYVRLLGARWWLVAAGLVVGAVIGYAITLGGSQQFKATATLYLGQPYSASGNVQLQAAQTNPSTVRQIAHAELVARAAAQHCKAKPGDIRGGISTQTVSGNIAKNGQTPLVTLSVQAKKRRLASCTANALARAVIDRVSAFANQKIGNFSKQISTDELNIAQINRALESGSLSATDKLVIQIRLAQAQTDKLQTSQLLLQATQVEKPAILTGAAAQKITARSRRNTAVVAALIGLVLGAIAEGMDVACVMAADNQMDPRDLESLAVPVARGEVDYAKANRLVSGEAWDLIPRTRYLGNAVLSLLTKVASGYWHVADSQSGYTAIGKRTLELLDLDRIYPRYGFPNDMLVHLNVINARVRDVPSRPVHGVGEKSGIRLGRVIPSISWLLTKAFFWRMREKYVS